MNARLSHTVFFRSDDPLAGGYVGRDVLSTPVALGSSFSPSPLLGYVYEAALRDHEGRHLELVELGKTHYAVTDKCIDYLTGEEVLILRRTLHADAETLYHLRWWVDRDARRRGVAA